jgi:hypothetical protein
MFSSQACRSSVAGALRTELPAHEPDHRVDLPSGTPSVVTRIIGARRRTGRRASSGCRARSASRKSKRKPEAERAGQELRRDPIGAIATSHAHHTARPAAPSASRVHESGDPGARDHRALDLAPLAVDRLAGGRGAREHGETLLPGDLADEAGLAVEARFERDAVGRRELAVDVGHREELGFARRPIGAHRGPPGIFSSSSRSLRRAWKRRDITVPSGIESASAISLYARSSKCRKERISRSLAESVRKAFQKISARSPDLDRVDGARLASAMS